MCEFEKNELAKIPELEVIESAETGRESPIAFAQKKEDMLQVFGEYGYRNGVT